MARFILDVANCEEEDIKAVMKIIDRDEILSVKICTLNCIDETNENQFHNTDTSTKNKLSKKQIKRYNKQI